jgi:protoporphyrinogen oxidase
MQALLGLKFQSCAAKGSEAMQVIILGSGAMGLAAAYQALCDGHQVTVLEADSQPGGMAAHFDFSGLSIERYYHFICKSDTATFELLRELGMEDKLIWRETSMGFFTGGKLYEWGNPVALLKFPGMGWVDKFRYGLFAFVSSRRNSWPSLEHRTAKEWITTWCGQSVYELHWKPLFQHKFYEYQDNISASWIWTRIRRIGRSRKSLMQEQLGYIEGGTETLIHTLAAEIERRGGRILLGNPATRVTTAEGRVTGVETPSGPLAADAVISTVPTPFVSRLIPDLPDEVKQQYDAIPNIGICCLIFKLRRSLSPHFWVNLSDPSIEIPGLIEFSNLRPVDGTVVYVPYYMPVTQAKYSWPDERLLDEAFVTMQAMQPALTKDDVLDSRVARLRYAQPVCPPDFLKMLPPVRTAIAGLQVADTCFYYPEDRGIAESVRLGRQMARDVKAA